MIVNKYPVSFRNFMTIKSVGTYLIMYTVLDDRIHFEMPIENAVYVTQRFLEDIEAEIEQKALNYRNDKIALFLRTTLSGQTFYKYYPTEDQIHEIKKIKLYDNFVVNIINKDKYDMNRIKLVETDATIKALNGNELVLEAEKIQ